jgi:flagellar biosynthesis/type III secretory pathway protein FliH
LDVIIDALPEALRQIIEARMESYQYKSEFARKYYGQGLNEGMEKGREEGLEKGLEKGLRTALLALARAKLGTLTDDEVAAIDAMHDQGALTELVTVLGQAAGVADARSLLERARTR